MKQEEKQLLLVDLCGRLPYGVKFYRESWNYEWDQELSVVEILEDIDKNGFINNSKVYNVVDIKPYLRPMSSMTEEERKNFIKCAGYEVEESENGRHYDYYLKDFCGTEDAPYANADAIDWLNAHHFDYHNLIERDLAIAVTENNNPYEN